MNLIRRFGWYGLISLAALTITPLGRAADASVASTPAWPGASGQRAWDDLANYYAHSGAEWPGQQALTDLESVHTSKAQAAGEYLAALLAQAFADESNGRTTWTRTPYWGGGSVLRAREFRKKLSAALGQTKAGPSALPSVRWLLETERDPEGIKAGVDLLRRVHNRESDALVLKLITQPTPNQDVLVTMIEEAGRRGLKSSRDALQELCTDYRPAVRAAAEIAAKQVGARRIPAYKPPGAISAKLADDLQAAAAMVYPAIPRKAKWVWCEPAGRDDGDSSFTMQFGAWVLAEKPDTLEVLTYFGTHEFLSRASYQFKEESLLAAAMRVNAIRHPLPLSANHDQPGDALSRRGGLTGQFEAGGIAVPEILVSAWLLQAGDRVTAAALFLPRAALLKDERWLREITRDEIGKQLHQEMLDAFCHDRDYAHAIAIAAHLSQPLFAGYGYQARAIELHAQLAQRTADFQTLTLPTPGQWKELSAQMEREAKVRYLAERLRLLSCVQWGQPGGINYAEDQFVQAHDKGEKVINPYNELLALRLRPEELKPLLPYLADRDYILAYSYWRDFHPERLLHRVSWLAAEIVNLSAGQPLVDGPKLDQANDEERAAEIKRLGQWCDAHAGLDHAALDLDIIKNTRDWNALAQAVARSIDEGYSEKTAAAALARWPDFPKMTDGAASLTYYLHSPLSTGVASTWATHPDQKIRIWAGMILLDQREAKYREEGLKILAVNLKNPVEAGAYGTAIMPLLRAGMPEATKLAAGILLHPKFKATFMRADILHGLLAAGVPEAFDYVLKELDNPNYSGSASGKWAGKKVSRETSQADWTANEVARWRKGWEYPTLAPEETRRAAIAELKQWLTTQEQLLRQGKKSEILPVGEDLIGNPRPRIDAP